MPPKTSVRTQSIRVFSRPVQSQEQSIFFTLPRELRDDIYSCYVHEEDGYYYDALNFRSLRFRLADDRPINASLQTTCQRVAQEMEGVALQSNNVHFYPQDWRSPTEEYSNSLRFKRLLACANITKWRMLLLCPNNWVTPEILREIEQDDVSADFTAVYRRARDEQVVPFGGIFHHWYECYEKHSISSQRALQHVLRSISSRSGFEQITADACRGDCYEERFEKRPMFIEGSHMRVLSWNPDPWKIPTDAELFAMECLLADARDATFMDDTEYCKDIRWNFSAAAVAIHTLRNLPGHLRRHARKIVLLEHDAAVSSPASHIQGFLPFWRENPKLRIERRVRGYYSAFRSRFGSTLPQRSWEKRETAAIFQFQTLLEWMDGTRQLARQGISNNSFSLVFENDGDKSVWSQLGRAVQLQETMNESLRRSDMPPPPLKSDVMFLYHPYPFPCNLPSWLPKLFRDIISGDTALIQYDGFIEEIPDIEEAVIPLKVPVEEWRLQWESISLLDIQVAERVFLRKMRLRQQVHPSMWRSWALSQPSNATKEKLA